MTQPTEPARPTPRVLAVDDSELVRQTVSAVLSRLGVDVDLAEDGDSALASITRRRPDLLILDIQMPNRDGLATLSAIRGNASLRDLPVFILTAVVDRESAERGADLRADGYLLKSELNPADLRRRVGRYLGLQPPPRDWDADLAAMDALVVGGQGAQIELVRSLGEWGCGVIPCDGIEEALDFVSMSSIDIIFISQEQATGHPEALAKLNEQRQTQDTQIPLVLVFIGEASGADPLPTGYDQTLHLPAKASRLRQLLKNLVLGVDPTTNPLTRERLLRHADGDENLARQMVEIFTQDAPPMTAAIEAARTASDLATLKHHAHELRGMLAVLGAGALADAVRRVEVRADQDKSISAERIQRLQIEVDELITQLQSFLVEPS